MVILNCLPVNETCANIDLSSVTFKQMGAAHKVICSSGNYYLVENASGQRDADGNLIEYKVSFDHGIQCTCRAGQHHFVNCHNYCWHVRACLACEKEERAAIAAIAIAQAQEIVKEAQSPTEPTFEQLQAASQSMLDGDGKPQDLATVYRVLTAKPKPTNSHQKGIYRKPFSILR